VYWQVTLNHHAITLATVAPYDTIHLVATPRTVDGTPIPTTALPVFTANDTSIMIDSLGMVRVHGTQTKTNIIVTARLTVQGTTLVDTAYVNVVQQTSAATVPVMQSLQLRPVTGDSAIRSGITATGEPGTQTFASPLVTTVSGDSIPNVVVRFASANPLIASFEDPRVGTVTAVATGRVLLTAEATVYGRRQVDSLWYTVGWPVEGLVQYGGIESYVYSPPDLPNRLQQGADIVINQGGMVIWVNSTWGRTDNSLDVQFDDTTAVAGLQEMTDVSLQWWGDVVTVPPDAGGNILPFGTIVPVFDGYGNYFIDGPDNVRVRIFSRVGTYHWHSLRQGIMGTIHVLANDAIK
jgi:hypothetical protein